MIGVHRVAALLTVALLVSAVPAAARGGGPTVTDHVIESFDGTRLEATLFVPAGASPAEPVPLLSDERGGVARRRSVSGARPVALSGTATGLPVVPILDLLDPEEVLALTSGAPPEGIPALPITSATVALPGDPRAARFPFVHAAGGPLEVRGVPDVTLRGVGCRRPGPLGGPPR